MRPSFFTLSLLAKASLTSAASSLAFNSRPLVENRTIDEIYQAALQEGGVVTLWHGGDEHNQQDGLKQAFEKRFPGMTLNMTIDLSKYVDANIDELIADDNLYIDSTCLQTTHDFPRWKEQGVLLNYAPLGFDKIHPSFRDIDAAFYAVIVVRWSFLWNTNKWNSSAPIENFADFLNPELKDRIVVTYPHDDDAVLQTFDLAMQQLGTDWFDKFLLQNPRWVRGSATPTAILSQANNTYVASLTTGGLGDPANGINSTFPQDAPYVSWAQPAAIFKNAPHPEGAKLLHNFRLSEEWLFQSPYPTVRVDQPADYPNIFESPNTNVNSFVPWMSDRARIERLKLWFESKLGTPQGLSPLVDSL